MRSVVFLQAAWRAHIRRRIMLRVDKEAAAHGVLTKRASMEPDPPAAPAQPSEPPPQPPPQPPLQAPELTQERLPSPSLGPKAPQPFSGPGGDEPAVAAAPIESPEPLPRGTLSAFAAAADTPPPKASASKNPQGMAMLPGMA